LPAELAHVRAMPELDREKVHNSFKGAVNMTATDLENWLRMPASHAVGWRGSDGRSRESVGHASGRHIARILRKGNDDLTADDYAHMRKVVGFIRRHSAQRPQNIYTSRWRYSLMNWGHDPLKEDER
jgi:hypothetical protein